MAELYGVGVLGEVDYETYCGLFLNRQRAMLRRSATVLFGIAFALNEPPYEWLEAMADNDDEAIVLKAVAKRVNGDDTRFTKRIEDHFGGSCQSEPTAF